MNSFSERKYKDESPIKTIDKIRHILCDLGIVVTETLWKNSANGFYSVSVRIKDTNFMCNGKGTSQEYALASAYGELMERLQNQSFFRLSMDLAPKDLNYKGFYYAPDEKYISIDDFVNSEEDWCKIQGQKFKTKEQYRNTLKKWSNISYEDVKDDFVALPYINICNSRISYIPIKMICKMYMSNGMCAGNTKEEALVQGISEIIERYVNKRIVREKICPPTIPNEYIKRFPRIYNMVNTLESKGNYKVILKDCSLNEGYPVVGLIFIDKNTQRYFIKFGAHPIFEIAAERTLTELLQGQDINNMIGLKEFSYFNNIKDEHENLIRIFTNGSGYYPNEIFNCNYDYNFEGFNEKEFTTNKQMLNWIVNLLVAKKYNVFIRDVSYLGFPAYHIIIPGLSEIDDFEDVKSLEQYSIYNKVKKYIRNLSELNDSQILELIYYITKQEYPPQFSVMQFINHPYKRMLPWYYTDMNLFISALYYKIGDFKNSYKYFNKYILNVEKFNYKGNTMTYYRCVRDYIGTRVEKLKNKDIIDALGKFYPIAIITNVINNFNDNKEIFNYYGCIKCWKCSECKLKGVCNYDSVSNIYTIIKDQYAKNYRNNE